MPSVTGRFRARLPWTASKRKEKIMYLRIKRTRLVEEVAELTDVDPDEIREAGYDPDDDDSIQDYVNQVVPENRLDFDETEGWEDVSDEFKVEVVSYS